MMLEIDRVMLLRPAKLRTTISRSAQRFQHQRVEPANAGTVVVETSDSRSGSPTLTRDLCSQHFGFLAGFLEKRRRTDQRLSCEGARFVGWKADLLRSVRPSF
jgi:hypothetical protein